MRISDWSSDVCSSDLALCVRNVATASLHPPVHSTTGLLLPVSGWRDHQTDAGRSLSGRTESRGRRNRDARAGDRRCPRSEEHTSELQSLMRISYAVFCLTKKNKTTNQHTIDNAIRQINVSN